MRFDRFTTKAQEVVSLAMEEANRRANPTVDVEHLVWAILSDGDGVVPNVLRKIEVAPERLMKTLQGMLDRLPSAHGGQTGLGRRLQQLFTTAEKAAEGFKDDYVSTEHLFLGALADQEVGRVLADAGASKDRFLLALKDVRGGVSVSDPDAESRYQSLEKFTMDLTAQARQGKLDPADFDIRGSAAKGEHQPNVDDTRTGAELVIVRQLIVQAAAIRSHIPITAVEIRVVQDIQVASGAHNVILAADANIRYAFELALGQEIDIDGGNGHILAVQDARQGHRQHDVLIAGRSRAHKGPADGIHADLGRIGGIGGAHAVAADPERCFCCAGDDARAARSDGRTA